MKNQIDSYRKF